MMGLTSRQAECLAFVRARIADRGTPPSYDEIRAALRLSSKAGVFRLVAALVDRGHLIKIPGAPRSLALAAEPITPAMEQDLAFLSRRTGKSRGQLLAQAVNEFIDRQVRP
ncbi:hypothetical protein ABE438_14565 [Bosea sp. TWI1241]|uniref:LexA family protein n=1 Tax=Bosea sp. TWI1241 TaxID=3148904 RepID=UPI0032083557